MFWFMGFLGDPSTAKFQWVGRFHFFFCEEKCREFNIFSTNTCWFGFSHVVSMVKYGIITNPDIAGPCLQYPIHNQGCKGGSQVQTVKTRWTHPEEKCLSLSIYIIRYNYLDRDTLVKSSRFSEFNSIQKQYQPRICHSLNCASLWFCAIPARYSPLTPPHSPNLKV